MTYRKIRQHCLQNRILYEDPDFPAIEQSVYYSKVDRNIVWRRPTELIANPKFVVGGKSRFDLYQGSIGNCWYIAAAATIATRPELFSRVVPEDQGFESDYAGVFHFYFWRFGEWKEIVIDDRLPTFRGRSLIFCHNREEPNEFWTALLEKAYAKVHGSYEALDGGWTEDALVDFTGGIGERKDLRKKNEIPRGLFNRMLHDHSMNSLMGSSINATKETMENELPNGLVIGHAYSLTKVIYITDKQGNGHKLLRLRNPWGKKEWNGAWSDKSRIWSTVDESLRERICIDDENGEFWMSFEDWINLFEEMQICHLPPDNRLKEKQVWKETSFHGEWIRGVSAGGCGNAPNRELYWINPQYMVTLKDTQDKDKTCLLFVSLMQKHSRLKRSLYKTDFANLAMSYNIYKVKPNYVPSMLDGENLPRQALHLAQRGGDYQYYREVTYEFELEPGSYIIIPSLFEAGKEARFLLRFYTEHDAEGLEMDHETERIEVNKTSYDYILAAFDRYSGKDKAIDARELQQLLNDCYDKELKDDHRFDLESCRSMLVMMDQNKSGLLELPEVLKMWNELSVWKTTFTQFDKDKSQSIDLGELSSVFKSVGFKLSKKVLAAIVRRYGGKEGKLRFNDFVIVLTKVMVHMDVFSSHSKDGGLKGKAKFDLDEYMMSALYF